MSESDSSGGYLTCDAVAGALKVLFDTVERKGWVLTRVGGTFAWVPIPVEGNPITDGPFALMTGADQAAALLFDIIPTDLTIDRCPFTRPNRLNTFWIVDQKLPSGSAGLDDRIISVPNEAA